MKEFLNYIWEMPLIYFILIFGGLFLAVIVIFGTWFYSIKQTRSKRFSEMNNDFRSMRKRVKSDG